MADVVQFKYRAFLSYSHADTSVATRVHKRLEGFRIDKDLVGRATPAGPVPKTLRPIFRDRNDFDAGSSIAAATGASLDNAAAFILIASPDAARSKYVNEEVRLFKWHHPDRPLIPLIVRGKPGDPDQECFPSTLRSAVGVDGTMTDAPADIIAADLRDEGDGFELALAKVIARLIGVAPDDVYRRAERQRRSLARWRAAVAVLIAGLAIGGGLFFLKSRHQQQTLSEVNALVEKYSVPGGATAVPGGKASLAEAITAIAEGAATDPRYAQALELLKVGKTADAEPLLKAVAEDRAQRADKEAKSAAAAYRTLASIAVISDHKRAREYYAEAARLDPSDTEGMFGNGWYQAESGNLVEAEGAYRRVIAASTPLGSEFAIWAQLGVGDIDLARGSLRSAEANYRAAADVADRLAKVDPSNADWQRGLLVSYAKIGDVQLAQGDLASALASYRDCLAISDPLAKSDPDNVQWQIDLSASYDRIGLVQVARGDLASAFASYHDSLAITDRLTRSDPSNADLQRNLSLSYGKIGDVQVARGDLASALASYRDGLAIMDSLTRSDPGNADWQRDLSVWYERIGEMQVARGDIAGAFASYRAGLAITDRLAKSDPGNAGWQLDLSFSYFRMGDVQLAQRDLASALASYRDSVAIRDRLAKVDPSNADWQSNLSLSYGKIGDVQVAQGDLASALASYRDSLAISDRLTKSDPSNAGWQQNLSVSYERIGNVQIARGDIAGAFASYRAGLAITDRLAKSDPGNAGWQRDLSMSHARLAYAFNKAGQKGKALDELHQGRAIIAPLTSLSPDNALWKSELAWFDRQIALMSR